MTDLDYSTITVSGDDAFDFLQAQLAADVTDFTDSAPTLAAWCNPKGRVICLFRAARLSEGYTLSLPTELTDAVVKRLTMFRFRSKVDFAVQAATHEQLGIGSSIEDWQLANLQAGIPEIRQPQSEQFTPHMLNLDLLEAVSVDKGCYPGQEIVSRTHFRGATKRRLHRFDSASPVKPGDKVSDGERDVGEVLNAIGDSILAVVPTDQADAGLTVNGIALKHVPLPYLR
ncbi:MAG: hypothetical protein OER22_15930 [Gammaproteobacteria bacterium]|nr:hypothetical protein [Gammaproteobacteria bacterium]